MSTNARNRRRHHGAMRRPACGAAFAVALLCAVQAPAQDAAPAQPAGDEAEDDRAMPTLDELLGLEADEADAAAAEEARRESDEELERRLTDVSMSDVFVAALEKMALSVRLLETDFEAGLATQRVQLDVIAKLDQLIDSARQNSSKQPSDSKGQGDSSGQQKKQPGPQQRSESAASKGQAGQQHNEASEPPPRRDGDINRILEETDTEWGHLPARYRDMLKQGSNDYKSPLYRKLTEEYYKRLAEEGSS